ncbi:hypothetical protein GOODEAATRI_030142 [Goodea atripinnis]|uniref:Uncharacterized protein n=1 Tax=Goodea atripinnis TaxID=208336 RepID=A0ABV0NEV7_9TELE
MRDSFLYRYGSVFDGVRGQDESISARIPPSVQQSRRDYHPIDNYFPRACPHLWSRESIHLSDDHRMPLLTELMWIAACQFLQTPEPKPLVQSQVSRPY